MVDTLKLFISAANDLPDERELIGQIVTEIPASLGWQINLTQMGKKGESKELILDSDIHFLIFGEDIRAPVGYEFYVSRRMGKYPPILIKKDIPRTIAGGDFVKNLSGYPHIHKYASLAEFRKIMLTQIGQSMIEQAEHFKLKSLELENLSTYVKELEEIEPNLLDNVTGEDSIILTRERFMPKNGILLKSPDDD